MSFKVLQCNVNHVWAAQDLLEQNMIEVRAGICVIAEPVRIPSTIYWFGSEDGRAAIRWDSEILQRTCILAKRGQHYVTVRCGDVYLTSCYVSPNINVHRFQDFLEELSNSICKLDGK
ncbi:reverse transcriptase [Lasius niger]|uniref:Reverse transcriptase n=1 Tax=Lasius niger TaxID=67767 RepID=A0A0J7KAK6_LASNI|nr:reverse transcriptase [Lasius niger]